MNEYDMFFNESLAIFQSLEKHDFESAFSHAIQIDNKYYNEARNHWESRYLLASAYYAAGDYEEARIKFFQSMEIQPYDELSQFYSGNCYLRTRQFKEARICFDNALKIRNSFSEARNNLSIVMQSILQGHVKESDWDQIKWNVSPDLGVDIEDSDACLDIPIFINNRDRVECLQKLLDWLLDAGYRKIFVLDQASTYPPLLEFYETFRRNQQVHVLQMKNLGFQSIWQSGVLEDLDIRTPYIYTDSDVIPTRKVNIVQELLRTLAKHQFVKKVGAKLIYEDITVQNADFYRKIQSNYYQESRRISPNENFMPNDTTFSVYRNLRHYSCIYSIVRTDLEIRHLPWYYDLDNLPEDEKYYVEHANSNSTFAEQLKFNLKSYSSSSLNL